ncbi:DUF2326 domain-containing protein [Clostridium nigeriense]|uniref:DUF2326 domain-containing protein n=1 Tax=Clostridium nigeriense TaxID=1805470 RepID=UPI000829B2D3|nr:DUF2326 domain-containing protein [Clostridium nigeriense]
MFIKLLKISCGEIVIREMYFRKGINLIVDETIEVSNDDSINNQKTGNNVGKTTVLKLIDFCLGGKAKNIYSDTESGKQTYDLVKEFLIDNEILITLILCDELENEESREIKIERNFLPRKKMIRRINNEQLTEEEFEEKLQKLIIPTIKTNKPSIRQIISHNIRYKDNSINNTLKTLDKYTSDVEYENLYLFLLGCVFEEGEEKQRILIKIKQESLYKDRLEKQETRTAYEAALELIKSEIQELNKRKSKLNINENFEEDLNKLNVVKYKINRVSSEISNLKLRENIIIENRDELKKGVSNIDIEQLRLLYSQAKSNISNLQKTFEDLVKYHNTMVFEKMKFIEKDLPFLKQEIEKKQSSLDELLEKEKDLSEVIAKSDSFKELEVLIGKINEKYRQMGEYQNVISQLEEVEKNIEIYKEDLKKIDEKIFSDEFEQKVKIQINKFNKYFASVSESLYGEKYAMKYDIIENKNKQNIYKFSAFNANMSSGKKQGEILCFDIAYVLFADNEGIPCLHTLLNDKKELIHGNQLVKVANYIEDKNIQLVISILKDKLPEALRKDEYYVVTLSQDDKLFRIENKLI